MLERVTWSLQHKQYNLDSSSESHCQDHDAPACGGAARPGIGFSSTEPGSQVAAAAHIIGQLHFQRIIRKIAAIEIIKSRRLRLYVPFWRKPF